uniref:phospholipid-transporting ATPase ID-like n=1 Tax=Myxine glutinosa TaxID=7769 RepID=UPI00358E6B32
MGGVLYNLSVFEASCNPQLLGASAIEDRLQEGVPDTILSLLSAKLRVWVLTGDKQETAVNIGYSCNLLSDSTTELFILCGSTIEEVSQELRTFQAKIDIVCSHAKLSMLMESQPAPYALVINGPSLALALEPPTQMDFLRVAFSCQAVVCCRSTPLQKAQVVDLVKKEGRVVTLAIGDGANDVGMIKAAHIGVGITGREGTQAALASDFSFGQFRFLQRLLFVHGRLSYQRTAKFLSYFFFKNFAFTLVHFWFAFFNGFSAQTVYDEWFITLYNLVFTSLPVLALAIFDQDMGASWSLAFPSLYDPGRKSELFNGNIFMSGCCRAIFTSLALFFVPFGAYAGAADYQTFALVAGTSTLVVVGLQMAMDIMYWTVVNQFFLWGSTAVYFAVIFTMSCDGMHFVFPSEFPFVGAPRSVLGRPEFWFTIVLSVTISLLPTLVYRFMKIDLTPTLSHKDSVVQDCTIPSWRNGRV